MSQRPDDYLGPPSPTWITPINSFEEEKCLNVHEIGGRDVPHVIITLPSIKEGRLIGLSRN